MQQPNSIVGGKTFLLISFVFQKNALVDSEEKEN